MLLCFIDNVSVIVIIVVVIVVVTVIVSVIVIVSGATIVAIGIVIEAVVAKARHEKKPIRSSVFSVCVCCLLLFGWCCRCCC